MWNFKLYGERTNPVIFRKLIAVATFCIMLFVWTGIFPAEALIVSQHTIVDVALGRQCKFCDYCEVIFENVYVSYFA